MIAKNEDISSVELKSGKSINGFKKSQNKVYLSPEILAGKSLDEKIWVFTTRIILNDLL
jgi:hypothetical protein